MDAPMGACLAAVLAVGMLVGCADDGPSETDDPSEAQADAEVATCQAASEVQDLLSAAETGSSPEQADTTAAIRDLANAANRADNPELRSNASHLLVEWERIIRRPEGSEEPTAPADADVISVPLRAIVAECDRLDVQPGG